MLIVAKFQCVSDLIFFQIYKYTQCTALVHQIPMGAAPPM